MDKCKWNKYITEKFTYGRLAPKSWRGEETQHIIVHSRADVSGPESSDQSSFCINYFIAENSSKEKSTIEFF